MTTTMNNTENTFCNKVVEILNERTVYDLFDEFDVDFTENAISDSLQDDVDMIEFLAQRERFKN